MNIPDRLVMKEDVPYLRIVRLIPRDMRDRLPQHYIALLETSVRCPICYIVSPGSNKCVKRLPKEEHFHKATMELILFYHRKFDVQFPPLNWPVLLYRYIKRLTLPSMNYFLAPRSLCVANSFSS